MQATRDPALAAILQQATDGFTKLHREILVQLMPHGADLEPAVVEDLSNVTLTFINGLLQRFAHGDRFIDSPEQLDGILSAMAAGILKSPNKGRLTRSDGMPPADAAAGRSDDRVSVRAGRRRCAALASCQSIRCMVLYENRVSPRSRAVSAKARARVRAMQLSGVYKLPEPNPALTDTGSAGAGAGGLGIRKRLR